MCCKKFVRVKLICGQYSIYEKPFSYKKKFEFYVGGFNRHKIFSYSHF